jgi:hypothetical protein
LKTLTMTYDLAMAAGADAANRRMRKAGRSKWSRGDFAAACAEFDRLYGARLWEGDYFTRDAGHDEPGPAQVHRHEDVLADCEDEKEFQPMETP